ncbi:MAG: hypothetical protein OFPI_42800 [Osedax symbiont Rs2]|nr:MAG: hypothetical protein OFPI_42800 [Osedax symbiont Rs2]
MGQGGLRSKFERRDSALEIPTQPIKRYTCTGKLVKIRYLSIKK